MRILTVLTAVVCLASGLRAMDNTPPLDPGGRCDAAAAAMLRHDYRNAADLARECAALMPAGVHRASALNVVGIALRRLDRNTEAKQALEEALAETGASGSTAWTVAMGALAGVYRNLGDYSAAERTLRQSAADAAGDADDKALALVSLSDLLREEGRPAEAKVVLDSAAALPDLSWQRQVDLLVESAEWNRDARLWDASVALWNDADKLVRSHSARHWDGVITSGLGETWFAAGNLARAEPLLRRSVQFMRNDPTATSPQLATGLATMAALYIAEGKLALAEEAIAEAREKDEASLGAEHPQVAAMMELEAGILARRGEAQQAREKLDSAARIMSAHFGPESAAMAAVFAEFGDVEEHANRLDAAVAQYAHALSLLRQVGAGETQYASGLAARYAGVLKAAHRGAEAKAVLKSFETSGPEPRGFREK